MQKQMIFESVDWNLITSEKSCMVASAASIVPVQVEWFIHLLLRNVNRLQYFHIILSVKSFQQSSDCHAPKYLNWLIYLQHNQQRFLRHRHNIELYQMYQISSVVHCEILREYVRVSPVNVICLILWARCRHNQTPANFRTSILRWSKCTTFNSNDF